MSRRRRETRREPPHAAAREHAPGRGWRVRYSVFYNRNGGVFHAAGRDAGNRKHGYPSVAPKPFKPPREEIREMASLVLARAFVRELRQEFGDDLAVHIEKVNPDPPPARPQQLSLTDIGSWPSVPAPRRWMGE
jgi:hypothetical protein